MSIGLKRGTVYLEDHQPEWEQNAVDTISDIQLALNGIDADIRHIGSTAVKTIKAKPIIDIAIAVNDLDEVLARNNALAEYGIIFRFDERPENLLYVKGNFTEDTRTHHIHVVLKNSDKWKNYICFTDYLNDNIQAAKEYEALKLELQKKYGNDRVAYTDAKAELISRLTAEARKIYADR